MKELHFLFTKIYTSLFLSKFFFSARVKETNGKKTKAERDEGRERRSQTAILTHNFFSWPYYAELSPRPHLALLFLSREVFNWRLAVARCLSGASRLSYNKPNLFWPQAETDPRLTVSHVGICTNHLKMPTHFCWTTWLLPPIYTSASCAEKSLIDDSVKGQYAIPSIPLLPSSLCPRVIVHVRVWSIGQIELFRNY